MLFQNFNFSDASVVRKFKLDKLAHEATWKHYYLNYSYCLQKLFDECLKQNYAFNPKTRSIMFLIRHSFELCFKHNLDRQKDQIPLSHSFSELGAAFSKLKIPSRFKSLINEIDFDDDGGCYRYLHDKKGNRYFTSKDKIRLSDILEKYESCSSDNFAMARLAKSFDYKNRRLQWDLTLHLGTCDKLGQIRTQYDNTIELIIDGIILDKFNINKIYLPLLFLIRHSLELALKENILELQESGVLHLRRDINGEHSLVTLYNIYDNFLNEIDKSKLPSETASELDVYRKKYKELNDTIHNLDSNSRHFRFPVDKQGKTSSFNPLKLNLVQILKLYYLTDPFITFTNYVLEDNGVIELSY